MDRLEHFAATLLIVYLSNSIFIVLYSISATVFYVNNNQQMMRWSQQSQWSRWTREISLCRENHISQVVKCCNFSLRKLARVRKYINDNTCKSAMHALVLGKIDYCNSLLADCPTSLIQTTTPAKSRIASCVTTPWWTTWCRHSYIAATPGITLASYKIANHLQTLLPSFQVSKWASSVISVLVDQACHTTSASPPAD